MTDDQRKLTYLRDSVEQLQTGKSLLEQLLNTIQTSSSEEAIEVFRRLRSGAELTSVAEEIQAGKLLSGVGGNVVARQGSGDEQAEFPSRRIPPRLDHYERLVRSLALASPQGSTDIVHRLKASEDIPSILKNIGQGSKDPTQLIPRHTPTGVEGNFSSQDSTFGMVKGAEMRSTHASLALDTEFVSSTVTTPWTSVTQDEELVQHLLDLYFTWQHSFFQSFPEDLFQADFKAGRTKFCSAMLVNAICAAGCLLSDRGGTDALVTRFRDEASRLLRDDEKPTITTTATLYLISYIEGTKGELSALWMSSGASALMAADLSLQLKRNPKVEKNTEGEQEAAKEDKARCHAFWGCFHVDQISAFTLGRLPRFNGHGVTVELPVVDEQFDQKSWHPYEVSEQNKPGARSSTFRSCSDLSMIINGTLMMFFAPTVPMSGSGLVAEYQKYDEWMRNLPPSVRQTEDAPPHVLCLHMYYHAAVLLLFRPFLKAKITQRSDLVPREKARESANQISIIFELHRKLYGYSGIYMFQVHCLLTACTIHIISMPTPSPIKHFKAACDAFHDLSPTHEWARTSLQILRNLATKWHLIMPKDAEIALYRDEQGRPQSPDIPAMSPPSFMQPTDPANAYAEQRIGNEDQSTPARSAASNIDPALATLSATSPFTLTQPGGKRTSSQMSPPSSSQASTRSSREEPFSLGQKRPRMIATAQGPVAAGPSSGPLASNSPASAQSATFVQRFQNPANYLYSPLANQQAPLLQPVRRTSQQNVMVGTGSHNSAANFSSGGSAPTATMQQPGVKQETETSQASMMNSQAQAGHGQPHGQQGSGVQSGNTDANTQQGQVNQNSVDGLSFSDDFRDPFMGFLEVND